MIIFTCFYAFRFGLSIVSILLVTTNVLPNHAIEHSIVVTPFLNFPVRVSHLVSTMTFPQIYSEFSDVT